MSRLFVYGTLQRGDVRAGALAGARFVGEATTQPLYRLLDCGDYPALVEVAGGGGSIAGEVFDVSPADWPRLDDIEGVAERLYERRPVRLNAPFDRQPVEAYFYLRSTDGLPDCGRRWTRRG